MSQTYTVKSPLVTTTRPPQIRPQNTLSHGPIPKPHYLPHSWTRPTYDPIRHFYRASICEGGVGSRNSVPPSVCLSHACIVTKLNDALQIFFTARKGNHSATLIPRVVGGRCPLPSAICAQNDPPPSKNADFDRFTLITSQP